MQHTQSLPACQLAGGTPFVLHDSLCVKVEYRKVGPGWSYRPQELAAAVGRAFERGTPCNVSVNALVRWLHESVLAQSTQPKQLYAGSSLWIYAGLKDMRSQQQWQHSHPPQLQSVDKVGPGADFAMPPLKCHRSRDGLTSAPIANASYTCINLGSCGKWIVSNAMNVFGDADSKQILEEWGSPWRMSTLLACKAILFMKDQTRKFRNRSCSGIT